MCIRDRLYYKDANERWNNEYVSHKANLNKKYSSINERYLKAVEKANKFIAICRAYESRENILRTINAVSYTHLSQLKCTEMWRHF